MINQRRFTQLLPTALIYKLLALGCAYGLWFSSAQQQELTLPLTVPVTYSHVPAHYTIQGPTTVQLTVRGPRRLLQQLPFQPSRLQVDLGPYQQITAPNPQLLIDLKQQTLHLPDNVRLFRYTPDIIKVQLQAQPPVNPEASAL